MAPFLSFTAEEAWPLFAPALNAARQTIFTRGPSRVPRGGRHDALLAKWGRIRTVRADVLSNSRRNAPAGRIGSSLQAELDLC